MKKIIFILLLALLSSFFIIFNMYNKISNVNSIDTKISIKDKEISIKDKEKCDINGTIKNKYYLACVDRYKLEYKKVINHKELLFESNIFFHINIYILFSLLENNFSKGGIDSINSNSVFFGYKFYVKYYSKDNMKNRKYALDILNKIRVNYPEGKTVDTNDEFINIFYNGYIKSDYFEKKDFLSYFNSIMKPCIDGKQCYLKSNFNKELIFYYYYFNDKLKNINTCKRMVCNHYFNSLLR